MAAPCWGSGTVTTGDPFHERFTQVGENLKCQCGCSYTVSSCNMLSCSFREKLKPEIIESLKAGVDPAVIVEQVIEKYGSALRNAPRAEGFGLFGWVMPFAVVLIGFMIAPFVIRRWKRHQPLPVAASAVDAATVERFRDEMERQVSDLE